MKNILTIIISLLLTSCLNSILQEDAPLVITSMRNINSMIHKYKYEIEDTHQNSFYLYSNYEYKVGDTLKVCK